MVLSATRHVVLIFFLAGLNLFAEEQKPQPSLFSGTWVGSYSCGQGVTGLTLSVSDSKPKTVRAVFHFYSIQENPNAPSGCYQMIGIYNDSSRNLTLTGDKWLERPPGFEMVGLTGHMDSEGQSFSGRVIGIKGRPIPGCTTFALKRGEPPTGLPPSCQLEDDRKEKPQSIGGNKSTINKPSITIKGTDLAQLPVSTSAKSSSSTTTIIIFSIIIIIATLIVRRRNKQNKQVAIEQITIQAGNPLKGCWICTSCGWFGRGAGRRVIHPGGTRSGCIMVFGVAFGSLLIIVGIPLLFFFGVGVIPILAGIMIILTTLSTTAITSSQASINQTIAITSPNNCPSCNNHTVIPATSPIGQSLIDATPNLQRAAAEEVDRINEIARQVLGDGGHGHESGKSTQE